MQPASREQIVAIIRQRAERHREFAAGEVGIEARGLGPGPAPPPFMAPGLPHHPPIPMFAPVRSCYTKSTTVIGVLSSGWLTRHQTRFLNYAWLS